VLEEVHVALVGGGDVEGQGSEQGVAGLLEDDGAADVAEAEAAVFVGDVGGQQAGGAGEGIKLAAQVVGGAVAFLARIGLTGKDLVADEGAGAELQVEQVGGMLKSMGFLQAGTMAMRRRFVKVAGARGMGRVAAN